MVLLGFLKSFTFQGKVEEEIGTSSASSDSQNISLGINPLLGGNLDWVLVLIDGVNFVVKSASSGRNLVVLLALGGSALCRLHPAGCRGLT